MSLQRKIGNQATQSLIQRDPTRRRRAALASGRPQGGRFSPVDVLDLDDEMALITDDRLRERYAALVGRMQAAETKADNAYTAMDTFLSTLKRRSELLGETNVRAMKKRGAGISASARSDDERLANFAQDKTFVLTRRDDARFFGDAYMEATQQEPANLDHGSRQLNNMELCVRDMEDRANQMEQQLAQSTQQSLLDANLAITGFQSLDKASWNDIRSKASDAAVAMDKRKMKAEKYFTYQQADYDNVSAMLQEARQAAVSRGLPEDIVEALAAAARQEASDTNMAEALTLEQAASLIPSEHRSFVYKAEEVKSGILRRKTGATKEVLRKKNARIIQKLFLFARVQEEAQRRADRAALYYNFITTTAQESLSVYDEIAALLKLPEDQRGDKSTAINRVGNVWANVLLSDKMRAELKRDKARVKQESTKLNSFGQRQMSTTKGLALKITAGLLSVGTSMTTAGRYSVEAESIGAGYQTKLTTESRAEKIKKLLLQVSGIWKGSGFAGSGLGGAVGRRVYAVMQLLSGAIPLFKPIFTTIGTASTIIGAILGLASMGSAAAPFSAISTTTFAINLALSVVKTLTDLAMLVWTGVGALAANDPRARISLGGKWRQKALESSGNAIDLAGSSLAFVAAGVGTGNPLNAVNPAYMFNRVTDGGGTIGSILGESLRNPTTNKIPMAAMIGGMAIDKGVPIGLGVGNTVAKGTAGGMAMHTVGSHLLTNEQERGNYQAPTQERINQAQARQDDGSSDQETSALQGADQLQNVAQASEGIVSNLQSGVQGAQSAAQQQETANPTLWQRFKGFAKTAMLVAWEILATITILPGLIEDISKGIYRAVKADGQNK
ncbi:hypothetical protein VZO05_07590 [Aggregatilineales bacterium SYSU G02658]